MLLQQVHIMWIISLQSVCAKIMLFWMIAVERHSAQKLHSSAITLLQIFDLFFAGSQVATVFMRLHVYQVYEELFITLLPP